MSNAEKMARRYQREKAKLASAELHGPEGNKVTKWIIAMFGDGDWHPVEEMEAAYAATGKKADIRNLARLLYQRAQLGCRVYGRQVGKSWKYQIFQSIDVVSIDEIRSKLQPLINDLKAEGRKSEARIAPPIVRHLAVQLQQVLDEWAKATEAGSASNDDGVQSNDEALPTDQE